MKIIETNNLLWEENFSLCGEDIDRLISFGVVTFATNDRTTLKWTSILLKEFIIQYAMTIKTDLPPVPMSQNTINYHALFPLLGQVADTQSQVRWVQENTEFYDPLEASFQAEFFRVLKGMFAITKELAYYTVVYEGRVGGSKRRFDLLFHNAKRIVVELKVLREGLSERAVIENGTNQVLDYAELIGAHEAYLLVCGNYEFRHKSPISVEQVTAYDEEGDEMDADYVDSQSSQPVPTKYSQCSDSATVRTGKSFALVLKWKYM